MSAPYYIVSLKNTKMGDPYVCFWRPDNAGYSLPLSWSGKYTDQQVQTYPDYYHNGVTTLTVRCEVVDPLGIPPQPNIVDGDAGPVVPNTRESWDRILSGMISRPPHDPAPRIARMLKGGTRQ